MFKTKKNKKIILIVIAVVTIVATVFTAFAINKSNNRCAVISAEEIDGDSTCIKIDPHDKDVIIN